MNTGQQMNMHIYTDKNRYETYIYIYIIYIYIYIYIYIFIHISIISSAVWHTTVHHLDDCLLFKPRFRCDQIQDGANTNKANLPFYYKNKITSADIVLSLATHQRFPVDMLTKISCIS